MSGRVGKCNEQNLHQEYEHERNGLKANRPGWSRTNAMQAVVKNEQAGELGGIERALIQGDLSKLSEGDRLKLYNETCKSLGLNPLTKPFEYVQLNGRLTLYARKDCTDQLRNIKSISITKLETRLDNSLYIVTAYATDKDGRTDVATGALSIGNLKGDALANAIMKCETKAKRRVTLSLAGLGFIDETEIETIPDAKLVNHEAEVAHQAIEQQPQQKSQSIENELAAIKAADNLETLQDIFGRAWSAHKYDFVLRPKLEEAYKSRKTELRGCL
jgi:hypothetical protein